MQLYKGRPENTDNRQKTAFYLLLMPGDKKFKTKELSSQINSARLSFAEAEDMLKYLDIQPGARVVRVHY